MTDDRIIISAAQTDPGRKRANNEDFCAFFEPDLPEEIRRSGRLYVVADGVGGAAKGERASQYAAQKVLYEFYRGSEPDIGARLRRVIREAGNDIFDHIEQSGRPAKMATTMVAAVIRDEALTVANVGDSRSYLIRAGHARQITRDHTIAGEMLQYGEIDEQEARSVKGKNRLTRSLGGERDVHVDVFQNIHLQSGDRVLLCSDGLDRYASREDIARLASLGTPEEAAGSCIEFANQRGGGDNVTVIVVHVGEPQLAGAPTIPRRGLEPGPVDWDEMVTQPSVRPLRRGTVPALNPSARRMLLGFGVIAALAFGAFLGTRLARLVLAKGPGTEPPLTGQTASPSILLEGTSSEGAAPSGTGTPAATIPVAVTSASPSEGSSIPPSDAAAGATWTSPVDSMVLVSVPGGSFLMGSTDSDPQAYPSEKPQDKPNLLEFWIDQTEVTNAMYIRCVSDGACTDPQSLGPQAVPDYFTNSQYAAYPVVNVTWHQARAYCGWAGRQLPSEAQWEKAARGSDGRIYPWGDDPPTAERLNFTKDGFPYTAFVGYFLSGKSPYGALDMAGNVWEWTLSLWGTDGNSPSYRYPYDETDGRENPDASSESFRVIRGGACCDPDSDSALYLRAANRGRRKPQESMDDLGFRCLLSVPP